MDALTETRKKQRGTKRVCRSCEERFYDLGRDPTVCPMCKASLPLAEYVRRVEPTRPGYSGGWSSRKPLVHTILPAEEETAAVPDDVQVDDAASETPAAEGDVILEQEEELESDVSDLLAPDGEATPDE